MNAPPLPADETLVPSVSTFPSLRTFDDTDDSTDPAGAALALEDPRGARAAGLDLAEPHPAVAADVIGPAAPDEVSAAVLQYESVPVEAPAPSLRARAVRGSLFTAGGHSASIVMRLGTNMVLTRLLAPELFGLMGLVNIFLNGLQMFSDLGVGPSIIQNRRGEEPAFLRTAWTIQVTRGVGLFGLSLLIAWPVSHFYGERALLWLVPLAAVNALVAGFNSTAMFRVERHLELGKLTLLNLATQVMTVGGMILWAYWFRNVYALLVPGLLGTAFTMFVSHRLLPKSESGGDGFGWDAGAAAELMHFGKWIFLSTLLAFGTNQADRLVLGKMIPLELLGVYGIGMLLATMPAQIILKLGQAVAFPAYSRVKDEPRRFASAVHRVRTPLLLVGAASVTGLIAGGQALINLMYDQRYVDAGWVVQAISAGVWFQILGSTNGSILLAKGESRWLAVAQGFKLTGMVGMMLLGYRYGLPGLGNLSIPAGFPGAVAGVAGSELIGYAVSAMAVHRMGLKLVRRDALLTLAVAGTSAVAWTVGRIVGGLVTPGASGLAKHLPALAELAAIGALVAALWLPFTAWQWRRMKRG